MRKSLIALSILVAVFFLPRLRDTTNTPYIPAPNIMNTIYKRFPDLINWKRPEGPVKIALQIGHFDNDNAPDELERLRNNDGAEGGGYREVDVNKKIAEETALILREQGYFVEILPAIVPPSYWADVFISIHADGNPDRKTNGFKVSEPKRDITGRANNLSQNIKEEYLKQTSMADDTINISENMQGYYAFSWWRVDHAIHPMTVASIVETGYITNSKDRNIIVHNPKLAARAIAAGILNFVNEHVLSEINNTPGKDI